MASNYKLTYFPVKALAEPTRMLFKYAGIEFDDCRIEKENWPEYKTKMPFGQMPILELNGKIANQSIAIARYAAKQAKLVGDNDWENLEIDSVVDNVNDLRAKLAMYHYESDEKIKAEKEPILFNETLPYYLERLDNIAQKNNGHLAAGKLTWADIFFVGLLDYLNAMAKKDLLEKYPNLKAVKENVVSVPAIKEWIASRPESEL